MHHTPPTIRIGFMPLTDCASLVMALERGYDKQHGIRLVLNRETSWAGLRDRLASGALDAAHALYGMLYGVQLGIGCQQADMAVLMNLSQNGQAITLSRALTDAGAGSGEMLAHHARRPARLHLRPDLPDRESRDAAVLLAGRARRRPHA